MRKITFTTVLIVFIANIMAQAPQGISHQAVIRNAANEIVANSTVGIKISILQGSSTGLVVYSETHTPQSNANGLISFIIGQGAPSVGVFSNINWENGPYFIKTEADPTGGTIYTISGISQMFGVPYSFYSDFAKRAESLKDGSNPGDILYWNGNEWVAVLPGGHDQVLRLCHGTPTWGPCKYMLTLVALPEAGGSVTGQGSFEAGSQVGVSATTNPGWVFVNWTNETGQQVSNAQSFIYIMPAEDISLTANFTEFTPGNGTPCPNHPTLSDYDGNIYNTILVGTQCWMKENLKTTTYRNGTPIDFPGTDALAWQNNTTGAYAWYGHDVLWKNIYGALYNWYAVNNTNGLCPEGWRIPSKDELTALADYAGGTNSAGGILRSTRTEPDAHPRWQLPNNGASDALSWSGLPGGELNYPSSGGFIGLGVSAGWWSSNQHDQNRAFYRSMFYLHTILSENMIEKYSGISVRCIKETEIPATYTLTLQVNPIGAGIVGGQGQYAAGSPAYITAAANQGWEFVNWTNENNQYVIDIENFTFYMPAMDVTLTANFIESNTGGFLPCPNMAVVSDNDGNVYNTVLIGTQCWMQENLKTTTYRNGTPIEFPGADNTSWENNLAGAYAWYNNDIAMKNSYGALYNWHAVNNANGLCPEDWHVPGHDEWTQLEQFVCNFLSNGDCETKFPDDQINIGWMGTNEGNALKSCRHVGSPVSSECNTTEHPRWESDSYQYYFGTDDFGFSALPGGYRYTNGSFNNLGSYGNWWSSDEYSLTSSWYRTLYSGSEAINRNLNAKSYGFNVRCVRNINN